MSGRWTQTFDERFWSKVSYDGPTPEHKPELGPCWIFGACTSNGGYGRFRVWDAQRHRWTEKPASQVAWFLTVGEYPPSGLLACHHCDNPPCVNPAHLFIGTSQDNSDDMVAKGRCGAHQHPETIPRGEHHRSAKLRDEQITLIRSLYATGQIRQVDLARQFGVKQATISRIVRGDGWLHIATPVPFEKLREVARRSEGNHGPREGGRDVTDSQWTPNRVPVA